MNRRSVIGPGSALAALALGALEPGAVSGAEVNRELGYSVASGCPDRAEWTRALDARLSEPLRAAAERRQFTVQIEQEPGTEAADSRFVGELGSASSDADPRRVIGASCREVADALTLIAALEVQREAPAPNGVDTTPGARAAVDPSTDGGSNGDASRRADELRVAALGFALFQSITAPALSVDLGAGVALSWQTEGWQPWVAFGVYFGDDDVRVGDSRASAHFERWATYFVGCPLRFPRSSPAGVRPCLELDVGRLTGEGQGATLAQDSAAWLASAGAALRFEWAVLEQLELGAQLGGELSLSRPRFFFNPEITALEVPAAGLRTAASASLVF